MLSQDQVVAFFTKYELVPAPSKVYHLATKDYLTIWYAALEEDRMFGLFFREALQLTGKDTYTLNFDNHDDLFDCYCSFITGLAGNKS